MTTPSSLGFLFVLAACSVTPATQIATEPPTEADTDVLVCEHPGCDGLCVPQGSTWTCTDTAARWELCYLEHHQRCEAQPGGACGWTMLDESGWDACVHREQNNN